MPTLIAVPLPSRLTRRPPLPLDAAPLPRGACDPGTVVGLPGFRALTARRGASQLRGHGYHHHGAAPDWRVRFSPVRRLAPAPVRTAGNERLP